MSAGCRGRAGGDEERRLAQQAPGLGGFQAAHPVLLQQPGKSTLAQAPGLVRRRRELPERQEPVGGEVVGQLQGLRIVAPELFAHPVGEAGPLLLQLVGQARPGAQLDDQRIIESEAAEAMRIGPQGIAEHLRIAPIVLGAGDGEAVAEAVELLGIDGVDEEAALEQRLDHGAVADLDGDGDRARLGAAAGHQPVAEFGKSGAAMGDLALADDPARSIEQADLMFAARPVDAGEPCCFAHHRLSSYRFGHATATPCHSLYWRSTAQTPHWTSVAAIRPPH